MKEISWPDLPADIGRYIFELAADHDPDCARSLLFVSQTVHVWIRTQFYRTVELKNSLQIAQFFASAQAHARRDSTFLPNAMKILRVSLFEKYDRRAVGYIFTQCTGIDDLIFVWTSLRTPSHVDPAKGLLKKALSNTHVRHLWISSGYSMAPGIASTFLSSLGMKPSLHITHLAMFPRDIASPDLPPILFTQFPYLIHFSLQDSFYHWTARQDWDEAFGRVGAFVQAVLALPFPISFSLISFEVQLIEDDRAATPWESFIVDEAVKLVKLVAHERFMMLSRHGLYRDVPEVIFGPSPSHFNADTTRGVSPL